MKNAPGKLSKNLAKNLRRLRGDSSQNQFAKRLGISQASLNRLELSSQNVTITTIERLCFKLDCTVSDLLELK